jgi:hypothetical protein
LKGETTLLTGKSEDGGVLGRLRHRSSDIIKVDVMESVK